MGEKFKNRFKKIMSVVGSVLLVGSTVGFAMAAGGGFPTPFVEDNTPNYAIVVGAGAAASDTVGASSINTYLNTFYSVESESDSSTITGDFSNSEGVTEDEVVLGSSIKDAFTVPLTDNKIPTLLDEEIRWESAIGSDTYDIHEEIEIINDGLKIVTTLTDTEIEEDVVLENNRALTYKYFFDEGITLDDFESEVEGDENEVYPLYLTILGKEYEVLGMDSASITVSLSSEVVVKTGDKEVVDGVTLTIGDIFTTSVEVNNVLIKEGRTRVVDGIEVYVDTIAYHSSADLPSKAIIKVGEDISQTIKDGEEYVEDDETWLWDINLDSEEGKQYIGVEYNQKSVSYDDDDPEENAISIGEAYALPENYGAVVFEGLTDVDYEDFELSFDDKRLYDGIIDQNFDDNVDVVILEGENDDSISIKGDGYFYETDTIYLRYNEGSVDLYFKDIGGYIDDEGRRQYVESTDVKLVVGDTELVVGLDESEEGDFNLTLTTSGELVETISIPLGKDDGGFIKLGSIAEEAQSLDVSVDGEGVGTRDDDVFTHYGIFVRDPESNADSDRIILSVPDEQVFAKVSIVGQGMAVDLSDVDADGNETVVDEEVPELGGIVIKDSEAASHSDKNLIIVGGSCINTEAARLLGGHACGSDFTLKTGVIAGQYIIQSFNDTGRIAVVVAGFHAADTTRAVNDFINTELDVSIGQKHIA